MTIEKGRAWGEVRPAPAGLVVVGSDAEARHVVEEARRAGTPVPPLGLAGGDLYRTMGGRPGAPRAGASAAASAAGAGAGAGGGAGGGGELLVAPVDLGSVLVDGRQHWFVAHLVVRNAWWRGRIVAAMNAEFLGDWDVTPRGHPNDGRLDVVDVAPAMPLRDRVRARRRLPAGTHVPHPAIRTSKVAAVQVDLDRPAGVWLDGERVATARRSLSVRIEPDALTCAV